MGCYGRVDAARRQTARGGFEMRDVLRRFQRGEITLDEAEAAIEARQPAPSAPPVGSVLRREAARPSGSSGSGGPGGPGIGPAAGSERMRAHPDRG